MTNSALLSTQSYARRALQDASSWLWHWLRRPWLAIIAGIIGVVLILAVRLLPQLPGQLISEQAASSTWLLNASSAYGIWGNFFLALGLFDVLRSPLVYLLLALLLPTLAAQLADQLGALMQLRAIQRIDLHSPLISRNSALAISDVRPLFRWRSALSAAPEPVFASLTQELQSTFARINQVVVGSESNDTDEVAPLSESRLLALRYPNMLYIRPLMMIGLMLAVIGAWVALAFGWQVSPPPLAPGATFRSANRNLVMHYSVALSPTLASSLDTIFQGETFNLPTSEQNRQNIGAATIQVRPIYPAVWLATTDGIVHFTLPGESKLRSQLGLVFASPGSEESILVPDRAMGLRIVRKVDGDGFVLEVYRSDTVQPVYRAELTDGGLLNVPLAEQDTNLIVSALPGLQIDVRHLPGLWLVPLGILLALIGGVAFLRPSAFALVQVAHVTPEESVVTLQSDHPEVISTLQKSLAPLLTTQHGGTVEHDVLPASSTMLPPSLQP